MIKFFSNNLVEQSTLTPSSENALFPAENVLDHRRTKVFRSTTNSDNIILDFGESSAIDSIIVVDDPSNGFGLSTITLQLNSTSNFTSPAFSQALTINVAHGIASAEFATQNYRFGRIVMTSTLGYCELSKVFIGEKIEFETGMGIDLGWSYADNELSIVKSNRYGQRFTDVIGRQRSISFALKAMDKDELDQILEIYDTRGVSKPFFIKLGDDSMINDEDRFAGMFFLDRIPNIINRSFGLYDMSMSLEEAM